MIEYNWSAFILKNNYEMKIDKYHLLATKQATYHMNIYTFKKVLRLISYGAGRRTFHTWLAPILPTQKQVGALGPFRVAPKDPCG